MDYHNEKLSAASEGDDLAFRTQLLDALLLISATLLLLAAALLFLTGLAASRFNLIVSICVALISLWLRFPLRRGHIHAVAVAIVSFLVLGCTALVIGLGTIHSVVLAYLLIPVMVCTFILGPRSGLALLVLISVLVFGLAQAERGGLLGPARQITPLNQWVNLTVMLAVGFGLLFLIRRSYFLLLARMRGELLARQEAEAALRGLNATLEDRVQERTVALSAANAELTHTAQLKDEFLASVSHELRTPLVSILGYAESLQEGVYGDLSGGQQKAVDMIEQGGQRLLKLVTTMLDLVTVNADQVALVLDTFPVARACTTAFERFQQPVRDKGLTAHLRLDTDTGLIVADERRLVQIIAILLDNAFKFTAKGGEVGLELRRDQATTTFVISVWDTGIGVAPERVDHLFKPFVQAHGGLNRPYEGAGLGLALAARLVELHGGSIGLVTAQGEGSRFTVRLPSRATGMVGGPAALSAVLHRCE